MARGLSLIGKQKDTLYHLRSRRINHKRLFVGR